METLELPVAEELEETPPANCTEDEIDLAAFQLWRQASLPDAPADGDESA
jgi:hypothetical protein